MITDQKDFWLPPLTQRMFLLHRKLGGLFLQDLPEMISVHIRLDFRGIRTYPDFHYK